MFFIVAGFLLVLFISVLNLTVTQGMINGLIFYANIVWLHQGIILSQKETKGTHFLAWLNLDFGIEACFSSGLNTFGKVWLQFIFPFYIWSIAVVMIIAAQYSQRVTKLIGNRAVPTLITLFFILCMGHFMSNHHKKN